MTKSAVMGELKIFMSKSEIRKRIIYYLIIITPAGFLFKFYSGPAESWFNDYGAGLLYEIFWILVIFFFLPSRKAIKKIPPFVFVFTSVLEILQLWHPWLLEQIRSTFIGRALIGTSFSWWDFPHYAIGCLIGWIWIRQLVKPRGTMSLRSSTG